MNNINNNSFGASALVYLKYNGEITELAKILSDKLEIPEIYLDTDMDPPHELFGMGGALGFELWLHKSTQVDGFDFEIKIETYMDVRDRFAYEMFDLSPWFAREISRRCQLETYFSTH